tara:strand:+ start:7 stop:633 length:627 start_codon:yes stop_codon:yes gene_type:complete
MADVNDMFNDITKEQSYYKAGAKKEITQFAKGEYLGHITKVDSKVVDVQNKYKARVYTYTVEVANENKDMDFTVIDIDGKPKSLKGDAYIGKKFLGKLWRFLEPTDKDTFESNSTGNTNYLRFCETIGVKCPKETKTIGGEDIEVQILPSLSDDDFLGQPVTAVVDLGKPWTDREGKRRQYWECKFCKKWANGKKKTISGGKSNEIPF